MHRTHTREISVAGAIALLALVLAVAAPGYFSPGNLSDLFLSNLPVLLIALGMTLVIVTGEIDIIAVDQNTICFIEVKTRRSLQFGAGYESVMARKQHKIMKTALLYLKMKGWSERDFRFDVISILLDGPQLDIEYLKGAFDGF